jgi:hypothetical protein
MGKKKLVMETSGDMVILICQGIASFVPIIAIVNVRLFRSNFAIFIFAPILSSLGWGIH